MGNVLSNMTYYLFLYEMQTQHTHAHINTHLHAHMPTTGAERRQRMADAEARIGALEAELERLRAARVALDGLGATVAVVETATVRQTGLRNQHAEVRRVLVCASICTSMSR